MIKRKNGVKIVTTILVFILVLITSSSLVLASNNVNEVTILDEFVIRLKNPSDDSYTMNINITYYDVNDDIIYMKEVTKELSPLETTIVDSKDYYNSEKTQKITVDIQNELSYTEKEDNTKNTIIMVIASVIGISLIVVSSIMYSIDKITFTTFAIMFLSGGVVVPILTFILKIVI